jgi:hypothetical protein
VATSLSRKLQVKPGQTVLAVNAPPEYPRSLEDALVSEVRRRGQRRR